MLLISARASASEQDHGEALYVQQVQPNRGSLFGTWCMFPQLTRILILVKCQKLAGLSPRSFPTPN